MFDSIGILFLIYIVVMILVRGLFSFNKNFFLAVNIVFFILFFIVTKENLETLNALFGIVFCAAYSFMIFWLAKSQLKQSNILATISFFSFIVLLKNFFDFSSMFGETFFAFRCLIAFFECKKNEKLHSVKEYFCFVFYLPLLIAGPISSYRLFFSSFDANKKLELSYSNFLRLLLGLLKILVLSVFVLQLTTALLISDYYTYSLSELIVSLYFNLIYAYLFLSGVCDVVISVSAIIGIDVEENFYCPIKSTNLVEFWKSWHVTLANAVKVTIFTPLFLYFRRKLRLKSQYYLTVPLTFLTFFLIGYFHFVDSRGWYLGLYHGFGVTICYVFNSTFKNQEFYLKLKRSIPYKLVCFGITWTFIAFSTLFFHYKNIDEIYNVIKTSF